MRTHGNDGEDHAETADQHVANPCVLQERKQLQRLLGAGPGLLAAVVVASAMCASEKGRNGDRVCERCACVQELLVHCPRLIKAVHAGTLRSSADTAVATRMDLAVYMPSLPMERRRRKMTQRHCIALAWGRSAQTGCLHQPAWW